jgi:phosphatidylinositol kinase/protein kinase (PI-3  family)
VFSQSYGVLPLKNKVGFVEWVENTVTQVLKKEKGEFV